jgi:glycosyltransferase involved in cell wall biosynthesis
MPTVSIIMNVRNGAATLQAALESAFAQTYRDWELIVWDDCSSDDSAAIIAGFNDPRVRYFLAPHDTSLGQARELAMRQAQGEWLAFLDQDDIWLSPKLEFQIALTDSPQVGLVYGRTVCFYPDGRQRDYDQFHEYCPLPQGDIFAELLGRGCFIAMSSAVIRRSAVEEAGGIPTQIHITPDYFMYLAVSRRYRARAVQQVVCRYRLHPGNMTSAYRRESLQETLALVEESGKQIPARVFATRHAGISTALALEEMRHWKTVSQGMQRLLRTGSLWCLVRAPLVRLWRIVGRHLRQPRWPSAGSAQ